MVQQIALVAQGGLRSLIHSVQRLICGGRLAVDDSTAICPHVDPSEDPWISGDAAKASSVFVLWVVHADPCGAHVIGAPDCAQVAAFADGE